VVWCIADNLCAALLALEGRESVLEDRDVIVGLRDLGLGLAGARRAEGAVFRWRVIGSVLPPWRYRDPLLEKRIPAKLAQIFS
jgi:hypothetical protein